MTTTSRGRPLTLSDGVLGAILVAGYLALLLASVDRLGYARDEGFYFQAASSYGRWFTALLADPRHALEQSVIDAHWAINSEHPPLMKSLFAWSNLILHKRLGLFGMEGTSFRFPGMLVSSLGVGLVYLWGARATGRAAGLAAAFLFAMMPRFFYQAHLACFDGPVVAIWLLAAFAYWMAVQRGGVLAPLLAGVAFGLALATKHNAWFLPFLVVSHGVAATLRARATGGAASLVAKRALAAIGSMAVLGPLVFYALWPWIWHDTRARFLAYAKFHLNHDYYNMEFLGQNFWTPPMPRGYAPLMTAATVPTITLLLFAVGVFLCLRSSTWPAVRAAFGRAHVGPIGREDPGATDVLWLLATAVSYGAWLLPSTPIFGGTKHWMQAYPFIALFAGAAFARTLGAARAALVRCGEARLARGPLPDVALAAAVLIAPIAETVRSHPWGLSAYTPLVGGASGAATLGLNRTFWGYTTGAVAGYLNRTVPKQGRIYVHDTARASWDMLVRDGRVRADLRVVGSVAEADFALYHHEKHMLGQEYQAWLSFGTVRPVAVGGLDGVPVIWIYARPR